MGYGSHARRGVLTVLGGAVLLTGIALLVLPGPGMLLVLAGLLILARAIPSVERFVEPVRVRAIQAAEESVTSWWRLTGSILTGLALIAAGVVWGLDPMLPVAERRLPLGGWSTGSGLILSGFIIFALMYWSYRRVRTKRAA